MKIKTKCNPCRCGGAEGETRKSDALTLLAERRESLVRRAQRALLTASLELGAATADDVRDLVALPPGIDAKVFGAAPGPLARAGIIFRDGFVPTCRPLAHARPVSVWKLADRDAALRWLDAHPELPDPGDEDAPAVQIPLFHTYPKNDTGVTVAAATPAMEE